METMVDIQSLSIPGLVSRFIDDIHFGTHSTEADARNSSAGKELQKRAKTNKEDVVSALTLRFDKTKGKSLSVTEECVPNGISLLLARIKCE